MQAVRPDGETQHRTHCLPSRRGEERNRPALPEDVTSAGLGLHLEVECPPLPQQLHQSILPCAYLGSQEENLTSSPGASFTCRDGLSPSIYCSHMAEKLPV